MRTLLLLVCLSLPAPLELRAQDVGGGLVGAPAAGPGSPAPPPSTQALGQELADADGALHALSKSFGERTLSDPQISARLVEIAPIQATLSSILAGLQPRRDNVAARLAELGPAPGAGETPEAPQIVSERRALTRSLQILDGDLKQTRLLQVEASQISGMLANRRTRQLEAELTSRTRSVLDPLLWRDFARAAPADGARVVTVLEDQATVTERAMKARAGLVGLLAAGVVALIIALPLRVLATRRIAARIRRLSPASRLRRTGFALGRVVVAILAPLAALLLVRSALATALAITPVFEQLAPLLIRSLVFAAFFSGLGRALLAPGAPDWRLAPLPEPLARALAPYPTAIGWTAALASFVRGCNTILGTSPASAIASDAAVTLVEILVVGAALSRLGAARRPPEGGPEEEGEGRLSWVLAALLAWLTLAAAIGAALLGYVSMANILMGELIWVSTVLASLFLVVRFVDDLIPALFAPTAPAGRFLGGAIGLSLRGVEQLAVLLSGAVRLALLLFGWAAVLAPFGAGAGDVFDRITTSQLDFRLGQVTISPGALLGALGLFLVGLLLTRMVRQWLELSYLPKTRVDVGVRASIAAGTTYLGSLIASLFAFAYLGLSFDRIALFASALSVGVGFGLQSVIGNFVSGLILLAERPVKVGDWIAIGDLEGDVKRINVRATEIEMQDRSKLIVPNSDLISKTVRNVTHGGSLGRVKIVLKTVDAADPGVVRDLILQRLRGHPKVRKEPAPAVYLTNVADGALEFTAFAYVDSPRLVYAARSELLFQIVPDLRSRGVALASSTPVVNVALGDRPIEPSAPGG